MSRLRILGATIGVVVAALSPVRAACLLPVQFVQTNGTVDSFYIVENGVSLPNLVGLTGSYWALGFGNPTFGVGSDNGSWSSSNWVHFNYLGTYFSGFWGDDLSIDGCINDPPVTQPAKMVVMLTRSVGSQSSVAVTCVRKNAEANYWFGEGDVNLKPIPKPVIANAARNGNQVSLLLVPISFAGLTQTDPFCAGANLITGYKIHARIVDRGQPAPVDRNRDTGGWVQLGGLSPSSVSVTCDTDKDVFLATSLVFDSGFETPVVSGNSTLVECGPNIADRPSGFRLVRKPIRSVESDSPVQP